MTTATNIQAGTRFNPYKKFTGIFIPEQILHSTELTPTEKLCYGVLCRFNGENNKCYPTVQQIADELCISKRHAQRTINSLVDKGYILKVYTAGFSNPEYHFIWNECFDQAGQIVKDELPEPEQDKDVIEQDKDVQGDDIDVSLINTRENTQREKTTTKQPPFSPDEKVKNLPKQDDIQQAIESLPDNLPNKPKIERIIKKGISNHDIDYVLQAIEYSNQNATKNYCAFLDLSIKNYWHEGYEKPEPEKPIKQPVTNTDLQNAIGLLQSGNRNRFDEYVVARGFSDNDIQICREKGGF